MRCGNSAVIDTTAQTVNVTVQFGSDLKNLYPQFSLAQDCPMTRFAPSVHCLLLAAAALLSSAAQAHDYPTSARVVYVQACMRDHPGPHYEMLNKCSCTVDALARDLTYDDFVTMDTIANANSIGGERGNEIRDTESLQVQARKFRQLQIAAKKSCLINLEAR